MLTGISNAIFWDGNDWLDVDTSVVYKSNSAGKLSSLVSEYKNEGAYGYYDYEYDVTYNYSYQYDDLGNISSVTDHDNITTYYTYDELNQLKSSSREYSDEVYYTDEYGYESSYYTDVRELETFDYDSNGNITSKLRQVYHNDELFSSDSYTYNYDTNTWCDALSTVSKNGTVVRNFSGSLTTPSSNGVYNFTWDGRQLKSATRISDNTLIEYEHDAEGRVIQKKVTDADGITTTTDMYYSGDTLIQQNVTFLDEWGTYSTIYARYIYDDSGLAYVDMTADTGDYYYGMHKVIRNAQGDIVALVKPSGSIYEYKYSAYGEILSGGSLLDYIPFAYRGYYYDADLGMYNLGTRYYDPEIGRFINADGYVSTGQGVLGFNMFAYCENNPINRADPTGESPTGLILGGVAVWKIITAIIGAVALYFATDSLVKNPPKLPSLSLPKSTSKSESKGKTKDIAPSIPKNDSDTTIIYRYHATKEENIAPRKNKDYDGLSFSTKPPKPHQFPAVYTTIDAVESTGILTTVRKGSHVSIVPTNDSVMEWINQGQDSQWSQALSDIVIEWEGVN